MSIQTFADIAELRARMGAWRRSGQRIAFVPTMGNLHTGHLGLVELARGHADRVVASIFVNPTQFGPNEDFDRYPRTPEADLAALAEVGCDLVFMPTVATMYPADSAGTYVEVPGLSEELCGRFRPGHFRGVATVVCKLFNLVRPDVAVFGEKDYQQLMVIRHLVRDLGLPVEIIGAPTARSAEGLALSSRNQYLSAAERATALRLIANLRRVAAEVAAGAAIEPCEAAASADLGRAGFVVDYVAVRRAADLAAPQPEDVELVVLAAARLGRTRLIDNLRFTRDGAARSASVATA